jgi:hypothetical protein
MAVTLLFVVLTVAGIATGRTIYIVNYHYQTIWIGIQGNPGMGQPEIGGFPLLPLKAVSKVAGELWV